MWSLLDYYFEYVNISDEEAEVKFPVLHKYNLNGNYSELLELIGCMSKGTALEPYASWMIGAAFGYCESEQKTKCRDKLKEYYDIHRP